MVKNTYGKDWKNWRDPSRLEHHFQTKAALRFSHDREVLGTLSRREKQLTSSATTTLDWDRHNFFNVTLTGDTTFEVINPRYDSDFVLYVKKDDNSTERTLTFPSDWTWLEGSSPDALRYAEERVLIFVYYYNEEYFARFNQFSSSASGYTARDLYSFGAIGDGVTDDTEAIRAALDWGASGGENGRAIHVTSGEYLMSSGAAIISLPNYSKMAIIGDGAGAGSILVANTQGGIHINCEGSSSIVSIYDLYIPAHYEGAGPLLKVAGQYNGSGGGVDFNTLIIQNVNGTPLQRSTSRYYSLNPFIFTRLKRPYIENPRYTPGKLAFTDSVTGAVEPRDWGTALMDLSNSYGPTVIGGKLGGSADYGILMDYTGRISVQEAGEERATEGGYVHDIRITQTKNSVGYYTDTEQPGLKIDGNHFNSSYRNIVLDGAKRFRIDNNFMYANNDTRYFWSKANPGDTLLTITSDEPHRIPNLADMLVRVNFSPEDTEDTSYDTDNDGKNDVSPSGTYDVTYISTTSFSIDDPLFAALPQTGNLQVRWSTADFSDNKIINGRHGRISQNMYGFLSSRRRKHWDFEDSESVKADPVLFDIQVYGESLTARTELEPLYVGPTADFITVKLSKITGDGYDRVGYPDNMSIVDDAATRITVIDSEDSFEERNEGGLINLVPNGKFARGSKGWDASAGWTISVDATDALTLNSKARYVGPDTSNGNLYMKTPSPCEEGAPVLVEWYYKVASGTVLNHRARANFYDVDGIAIGSTSFGDSVTSTPSDWTRRSYAFTVPSGAVTFVAGVQIATSTSGTVDIDRISVMQPISVAMAEGARGEMVVSDGGATIMPSFEYEDISALAAATVPAIVTRVYTRYHTAANKLGGAWYKRVDSAPSHSLYVQDASGAYFEIDELHVTPQMAGAIGDGVTDDLAAINAAKACAKRVYLPPGSMFNCGSGPLTFNTGEGLIGSSRGVASASVDRGVAGLLFSGTGTSCIKSADETAALRYVHLSGFDIYHTGTHSHVINLKGPVGCDLINLNIETTNNGTGGIKTSRIESSPGVFISSWVNNIHNCRVRVVSGGSYGGTARPIEFDFSDSAVTSSNFTGGIGSLYQGTGGLRMVACRFDHAYAASTYQLTVRTNYASVMPVCITACQIEEGLNGLLIDHDTNDATNTTRCMVSVVGNHFRCSDADGVGGGAEITLLNTSGSSVISGPVITGNTFASTVPEPFSYNAAHWDGLVIGPNTYAVAPSSGLFDFDVHGSHTVIDRYGMLLGDGAVKLANGQTIRGVDNANMLAAINGTGPGVLFGVAAGNAPFVHGSRDADGTARRLLFGTDATNWLGLASDGTYFRPETDNTLDLGQTSNRFKTVHGVNFRVGPSSGAPTIEAGSGSPEGVVTANPASLYLDYTNGHGYTKTSGSGNTGWELNSPAVTQLLTAQSVGTGTTYTVDNTVITRRFKTLEFVVRQLSHNDASNQTIRVELSGDNGSTWTAAQVVCASSPAATVLSGSVVIHNAAAASATRVIDAKTAAHGAITNALMSVHEVTVATGYVNAVRWSPAAGSFDGGTLSLIGRN